MILPRLALTIVCIYRRPTVVDTENSFLTEMFLTSPNILIVGDFIGPEINWETEPAPPNTFGESLLDFFHEHALIQYVNLEIHLGLLLSSANPSN